MQRIFLKPTPREIVIKGNSKDGHTDVFAYDYHDDDSKRGLGGLFIVGNVKQDFANTEDENAPNVAYVTNLIASLAKREYYSRPEISPRDAFSATLKKINDVVEEFFKNKGLKINVGILTIAGEQILISKLGKFKIILGRESRTIDILNNIDLFNKEQVVEKEFSNIISGKIMPGDKLFAFYPNRSIVAREKTIKADLLKFDSDKFFEKINSVKESKPDFDCGALYLSINSHKEPAMAKKPKIAIPDKIDTSVSPAKSDLNKQEPPINQSQRQSDEELVISKPVPEEIPRIISSEFSLGRKVNPLLASARVPIKIFRSLYKQNINIKSKIVILSLIIGVLAIAIVLIKTFVVLNPEQRQINTVISQSQTNLKLAQTKISQNDLIGARQLLIGSLSDIYAVNITGDKTEKTKRDIYDVLDKVDKTVEVSPSLLEVIPEELNQEVSTLNAAKNRGIAIDLYENNLYVLTADSIFKISDASQDAAKEAVQWLKSATLPPEPSMIAVDGNIYVMNNSGTLATYYKGEKESETNTFIVSNSGSVLLTSKDSDKLYLVNKTLSRIYELDKKSGSLVRTLKTGSSDPFVDAYLYGNNTIIVTAKDGRIWEVK